MDDQTLLAGANPNDAALRDPARLAALSRTELLDSIAEEAFDRQVRLAVRMLRVPVALVSLVDSNRQFFKSCIGLGEPWASRRETPLSHSFCQHAVISREPLIIEDAREHPLVRDNLAIPDLNVIAYAGIPLITHDGAALGSFCAIDNVPRAWSDDEIAILKDLAAAVVTEIELRLAMRASRLQLAEAERERAQKTAILESSASSILVLNDRCEIVFANSAADQILRLPPRALAGAELDALDWRFETPGGQPLPKEELPFLKALRLGKPVHDAECAFVRPDGTRVILVLNAAPVRDDAGHIEGVVISFIDQTARKHENEAQRFLARAAALLNSSLDYETTMAQLAALVVPTLADWCTVHLVTACGVQHIAAAHTDPGKVPLIHALHASYPYSAPQPPSVANGLRLGQTVFVPRLATSEHAPLLSRGREAELRELGWESLIAVPLVARGQMLGMISFVRARPGQAYSEDDRLLAEDLAGRAAVAVDNALLYQQTRQAVIARDGLFSMVTHDLKNPLTAIKGYTELLKRRVSRGDTEPARFTAGLANIESSISKIERQLAELADTSLMHSGRPLDLAYVPSDVGTIVRQVADELRASTYKHTIEIQGTAEPLIGMYDPARIERVFANLLTNAIKYSPNGGVVTVTLATEAGEQGRQAVISVRDQGIGIPAADLARIFEQFTRASNVGAVMGTGVGLASARQIVEQHGGTIEVASSEGRGSVFTVRLPLYDEETRAAGG